MGFSNERMRTAQLAGWFLLDGLELTPPGPGFLLLSRPGFIIAKTAHARVILRPQGLFREAGVRRFLIRR